MVLQSAEPIAKVARDLQIEEGTLGNWVARWREQNPEPVPELNPLERVRLRELEDQNRKRKMENELPKKPGAFFAQTHP